MGWVTRFVRLKGYEPSLPQSGEMGSDTPHGNFWRSDTEEHPHGKEGHGIPVFVGYGVNAARMNGADIEPVPITPVRWQNWPEMQIQLLNGWELTNYGKKIGYDGYLRMLTDSATKTRRYLTPGRPGNVRIGPAPANVQSMVNTTAGSQPSTPGGPGFLAANVDLSQRRNYG